MLGIVEVVDWLSGRLGRLRLRGGGGGLVGWVGWGERGRLWVGSVCGIGVEMVGVRYWGREGVRWGQRFVSLGMLLRWLLGLGPYEGKSGK